jgi:phage shock protein PspC (stress-responsive transcriptional regulator)
MDLVLMRVLWLGIALCTGVGFGVYLAAWIIIPSDHGYETQESMAQVPRTI